MEDLLKIVWKRENAPIVVFIVGSLAVILLTLILGFFGLAYIGMQLYGVLVLVCFVWLIYVNLFRKDSGGGSSVNKKSNNKPTGGTSSGSWS